jgi:two-component system phosphate regulon response regulator OmpR
MPTKARRKLAGLDFDLLMLDVMMPGENGHRVDQVATRPEGRADPDADGAFGDRQPHHRPRGRRRRLSAETVRSTRTDPRINNILRRGGPATTPKVEQLVFGPYTFQIARRELKRGGEALKLTDREQEILAIFAARAGETIPSPRAGVGDDSEVGERTIDVQINRLRRKIERDPANPVWLQTVRGIGYRLSVE